MKAMANKVLARAAELIEQGWCQGHSAMTADGLSCRAFSPYAVRWCEAGAMLRAAVELFPELPCDPVGRNIASHVVVEMMQQKYGHGHGGWGVPYNDAPGRTAEEVAAHLRGAMATED